jgi:hypothetical protein
LRRAWVAATAGTLLLVNVAWVTVEVLWTPHVDDFVVIYSAYRGPVWLQVLQAVAIWWVPIALAQWLALRRYASAAWRWGVALPMAYLLLWPLGDGPRGAERAVEAAVGHSVAGYVAARALGGLPFSCALAAAQWAALWRLAGPVGRWVAVCATAHILAGLPTAAVAGVRATLPPAQYTIWDWLALGLGGRLLTAGAILATAAVQAHLLRRAADRPRLP